MKARRYKIVSNNDPRYYDVEVEKRFLFWTWWETSETFFESIDEANEYILKLSGKTHWIGTAEELHIG